MHRLTVGYIFIALIALMYSSQVTAQSVNGTNSPVLDGTVTFSDSSEVIDDDGVLTLGLQYDGGVALDGHFVISEFIDDAYVINTKEVTYPIPNGNTGLARFQNTAHRPVTRTLYAQYCVFETCTAYSSAKIVRVADISHDLVAPEIDSVVQLPTEQHQLAWSHTNSPQTGMFGLLTRVDQTGVIDSQQIDMSSTVDLGALAFGVHTFKLSLCIDANNPTCSYSSEMLTYRNDYLVPQLGEVINVTVQPTGNGDDFQNHMTWQLTEIKGLSHTRLRSISPTGEHESIHWPLSFSQDGTQAATLTLDVFYGRHQLGFSACKQNYCGPERIIDVDVYPPNPEAPITRGNVDGVDGISLLDRGETHSVSWNQLLTSPGILHHSLVVRSENVETTISHNLAIAGDSIQRFQPTPATLEYIIRACANQLCSDNSVSTMIEVGDLPLPQNIAAQPVFNTGHLMQVEYSWHQPESSLANLIGNAVGHFNLQIVNPAGAAIQLPDILREPGQLQSVSVSESQYGQYSVAISACVTESVCSDATEFTHIIAPPRVQNLTSLTGDVSITGEISLEWSSASGNLIEYRLEERFNDSGFSLSADQPGPGETSITLQRDPDQQGLRSYRVSACENGYCGEASLNVDVVVGNLPRPMGNLIVQLDTLSDPDRIRVIAEYPIPAPELLPIYATVHRTEFQALNLTNGAWTSQGHYGHTNGIHPNTGYAINDPDFIYGTQVYRARACDVQNNCGAWRESEPVVFNNPAESYCDIDDVQPGRSSDFTDLTPGQWRVEGMPGQGLQFDWVYTVNTNPSQPGDYSLLGHWFTFAEVNLMHVGGISYRPIWLQLIETSRTATSVTGTISYVYSEHDLATGMTFPHPARDIGQFMLIFNAQNPDLATFRWQIDDNVLHAENLTTYSFHDVGNATGPFDAPAGSGFSKQYQLINLGSEFGLTPPTGTPNYSVYNGLYNGDTDPELNDTNLGFFEFLNQDFERLTVFAFDKVSVGSSYGLPFWLRGSSVASPINLNQTTRCLSLHEGYRADLGPPDNWDQNEERQIEVGSITRTLNPVNFGSNHAQRQTATVSLSVNHAALDATQQFELAPTGFTKLFATNDIWFDLSEIAPSTSSCVLNANCNPTIRWMSHPGIGVSSNVTLFNMTTQQETNIGIGRSGEFVLNESLLQVGQYRFRLRFGDTSNQLLAESAVLTVLDQGGSNELTAPQNVRVSGGTVNAPFEYSIDWDRPATGDFSTYTIEERAPGDDVFVVISDQVQGDINGNASYAFSKAASDAGAYFYRVRACPSQGECSPYSSVLLVNLGEAPIGMAEPAPAPLNVVVPPEDSHSAMVGQTSGQFNVSPSGAATYSIPILTVPGTAGVAPQVALTYSSQAGSGVAGTGWSLSALSLISRCGQTHEQDGRARGVRMDSDDRFCMDGQRLVMVNSNNPDDYGNDGIEYRTEVESFTRVYSHGDVGGSPRYFKVQRKDGSTSYYGDWCWDGSPEVSCTPAHYVNDDDSFIQSYLTSGVAYAWGMDWFEDSAGNYYDNKYKHFGAAENTVDFVLKQINYTGHVDQNPADGLDTSLNTYARIIFQYGLLPNSEVTNTWQAGVKVRNRKRLDTIRSWKDSDLMRYYVMQYSTEGDGYGRTRLDGFIECKDANQQLCFEAIEFDWSRNRNEITEDYNRDLRVGNTWPKKFVAGSPADINGDGLQDVLMFSRGVGSDLVQLSALLSDPSADQRAARVAGPILSDHILGPDNPLPENAELREQRFTVGDYNSDTYQDLIYADDNSNQWKARYWSAQTNNFSSEITLGPIMPDSQSGYDIEKLHMVRMLDVNGDGLADLLYAYDTSLVISLHQGMGVATPYTQPSAAHHQFQIDAVGAGFVQPPDLVLSLTRVQLLDYNGDGAMDILVRLITRYCEPITACETPNRSDSDLQMADAQGYIYGADESGFASSTEGGIVAHYQAWHVMVSDGEGGFERDIPLLRKQGTACDANYFPACAEMEEIGEDNQLFLPDLNSDGLSDLVYRLGDDQMNSWHYRLNRGTNYAEGVPVTADDILDQVQNLPQMSVDTIGDVQFTDLDGNGYADILFVDDEQPFDANGNPVPNTEETWQIIENGPGGLAPDAYISELWAGDDEQGDRSMFVDFNGDGRLDQLFVNFNSESEVSRTWLNFGRNALDALPASNAWSYHTPLNVITAFRTGIDLSSANVNTTRVHYGAMTRRTVYSRHTTGGSADFGSGSVVYDLVPNGYVVQSVESTNPHVRIVNGLPVSAGESSTVTYYYAGAKIQGGGRGFLGFAELMTYDGQGSNSGGANGILTTTRYRQDFPFTGAPYETVRWYVTNEAELPWNQVNDGIAVPPCTVGDCGPVIPPDTCDFGWDCNINHQNRGQSNTLIKLSHEFSEWVSVPSVGAARFIYVSDSTEKTWMPIHDGAGRFIAEGPVVSTIVTEHPQYDDFGNPEQIIQTHFDGDADVGAPWVYRKTSNDTFVNDVSRWHLSRLMSGSVLHERPGHASVTRSTEFGYDTQTGVLNLEVLEPNSAFEVRTVHTINEFGLKEQSTVHYQEDYGMGATTRQRTSRVEYDGRFRFVDRKYNAEDVLVEQVLSRNAYGSPLEVVNADGVSSHTRYDSMGKAYFSWSDVGSFAKTTSHMGAGTVCPAITAYHVISESKYTHNGQAAALQPTGWTCFDVLGREIRTTKEHFNGSKVSVDMLYDNQNRTVATSRPLFSPASVLEADEWTLAEYDALGRSWRATLPDGSITTTDYGLIDPVAGGDFNGRLLRITNPKGQQRIEQKNALDELLWVRDELGGEIHYDYDVLGNLTTTDGALPGTVDRSSMQYNLLGQKVSMNDPDKGFWQYRYNSMGDMLCQQDANGNGVRIEYDVLGRKVFSSQSSSFNWSNCTAANGSASYWSFNPESTNGYGKLNQTSQVGFENDNASSSTTLFELLDYDQFGRESSKLTQIEEVESGASSYHFFHQRTTYDEVGRVFQQFDASADHDSQLGSRHVYNKYGYLMLVREAALGDAGSLQHCYDGTAYYQCVEAMDAYGNVIEEYAGNGSFTVRSYDVLTNRISSIVTDHNGTSVQNLMYGFDTIGNLTVRQSHGSNGTLAEEFHYDGLNRLIAVDTDPNGLIDSGTALTASMSYDAAGNLLSRSGLTNPGAYTYGYQSSTGSCASAGPHAVCRLGSNELVYDANGNNTDGEGRYLEYTSRNKPWRMSKDASTTEFWYGAENRRFKRVDDHSRVTYYIGNVEVIREGTQETLKRYIASAIADYQSGGLLSLKYKHVDHLGSTDAITGAATDTAEFLSFDAFGQRRDAQNWGLPLGLFNPIEAVTTRGYTGHEHVDAIGIIHMNGRIYDARIGRFLQADPFIQAPKNSQNLNRYSYVLNNPLSYTDPDGYFFKAIASFVGRVLEFIAQTPLLNTVASIAACSLPGANAITCGAWATFSASMNGASLSQALKAGLIAGVSAAVFGEIGNSATKAADAGNAWSIGKHATIHATAGGVISVLQGGKFGHGFVSAGLSKAFSLNAKGFLLSKGPVAGAVITGLVGGTISEATGGKFANGAMSAAIAYRFNQVGDVSDHEKGGKQLWRKVVEALWGEAEDTAQKLDAAGKLDPETRDMILNYGMRTGQALGGVGQISLAFTLCIESGGTACYFMATTLAAQGFSNISEAITGYHPVKVAISGAAMELGASETLAAKIAWYTSTAIDIYSTVKSTQLDMADPTTAPVGVMSGAQAFGVGVDAAVLVGGTGTNSTDEPD